MTEKELKENALKNSLNSIDKRVEEWVTNNDKINLVFIKNNMSSFNFDLKDKELPIVECFLKPNNFLLTTERLLSNFEGNLYEMLISEMEGLCSKSMKEINPKKKSNSLKTNILVIKSFLEDKIYFEVDSLYPTFFMRILIYNLSSYKRYGKWYLAPK